MVNYFYVENTFDGENVLTLNSTYGMTNVQSTTTPDVEDSWAAVTFDTNNKSTINIPQSGKVYLRGTNTALSNSNNYNAIILCTGEFNIGGDLTTLIKPEGNVTDLTDKNYAFSNIFKNANVVNASKLILPSTTLAPYCYYYMFYGCTSLTTAPELPATTLAYACYYSMFYDCTSLTKAPELPAMVLTNSCYRYMFYDCTSLTKAPELPATTLAPYCYYDMFYGCTSLTQSPSILPATTLTDSCYSSMFYRCTSLTTAPELPATTLAYACYSSMFSYCTSLTTAPELPAMVLTNSCYQYMFYNCNLLNNINILFTNNNAQLCLNNWLTGVASSGVCIYNCNTSQEILDTSFIPDTWSYQKLPNYFYIENMYRGINILTLDSEFGMTNVEYNTSMLGSWTTVEFDTPQKNINVSQNGRIYLRGTNRVLSNSSATNTTIIGCSNQFNVGGDITTLLNIEGGVLDLTDMDNIFQCLFYQSNVIDAGKLLLPSTTLSIGCYKSMFENCNSLVSTPELPANILTNYCYANMFNNCKLVDNITILAADSSAQGCLDNWITGVSPLGIFTYDANISQEVLESFSIPVDWYIKTYYTTDILDILLENTPFYIHNIGTTSGVICLMTSCIWSKNNKDWNTPSSRINIDPNEYVYLKSSKQTAYFNSKKIGNNQSLVVLQNSQFDVGGNIMSLNMFADSVTNNNFYRMFQNQTNLINAKDLILPYNHWSIENIYYGMFMNCSNLKTPPQIYADDIGYQCYCHMFENCINLEYAPELPANYIPHWAYYSMFKGCKKINRVVVNADHWNHSIQDIFFNWLSGVSETGDIYFTSLNITKEQASQLYIPSGWTIHMSEPYSCFYIKNNSDNSGVISMYEYNSKLEYRTDRCDWSPVVNDIKITSKTKIYFRGNNKTLGKIIHCTTIHSVGGDITTLINTSGNITDISGMDYIFKKLFQNDINLQDVSINLLTPIKLSKGCYQYMFDGCKNLKNFESYIKSSPILLPATNLVDECYQYMFRDTRVDFLDTNFITDITENDIYTRDWLLNTPSNGVIYINNSTNMTRSDPSGSNGWNISYKPEFITIKHPLSIVNNSNNNGTINITGISNHNIQVSYDNIEWFVHKNSTINIEPNGIVYLKGYNNNLNNFKISCDQPYTISGDMTCLLNNTGDVNDISGYNYIFKEFFKDDINILDISKLILPSTKLSEGCYQSMFEGCTNLQYSFDKLPAIILTNYCYQSMFKNCPNLINHITIYGEYMNIDCLKDMFNGCTSVNSIDTHIIEWNENYALNWTNGVANAGMFINYNETLIPTGVNGIPENWISRKYSYFYLESINNAYSAILQISGFSNILYTFTPENPRSWTNISDNMYIKNNQRIYLKTDNTLIDVNTNRKHCILQNGYFNVGGDLTNLIDSNGYVLTLPQIYNIFNNLFAHSLIVDASKLVLPSTTLADSCYSSMFSYCTSLTTAPELPATNLTDSCYREMFEGCTSLTTAPELPAMVLTNSCYQYMFYNCTSLTTAPELPATTLAYACYSSMFSYCTSLTTAPELPATKLADFCYYEMFYDCTSLTTAPGILPATNLTDSCYQYMFYDCTSLTTAPELPATTLAPYCYYYMFYGCTTLTQSPSILPATILEDYCYANMFRDCMALITAPKILGSKAKVSCCEDMFKECQSLREIPDLVNLKKLSYKCCRCMFYECLNLIIAPKLPATTLADYCYYGMFYRCASLNKVTALFIDNNAQYCQYCFGDWLVGVAPTGTFIHNPILKDSILNDETIIPEKWTKTPIETPTCFRVNSTESNTLTIDSTVSPVIKYSSDNKSWTEYSAPVEFSGTLYLCGANSDLSTTIFKFTKPISTDADITTLLNGIGGKELPQKVFENIFKGNTITEARVKGNNLTNRAQTYVYDNSNVQQVVLHILNKDNKTYSEWTANIGSNGKLTNLARIGLVK